MEPESFTTFLLRTTAWHIAFLSVALGVYWKYGQPVALGFCAGLLVADVLNWAQRCLIRWSAP